MTDRDYYERLVDEDALNEYLASELGETDEYAVERHQEGHSNETLFVTWDGRDLVLRRPPPGDVAEKAHDVLREYTVVDALQDTDVPVPPTVLACDDHSVIGSDFYLMERVEGSVFREGEPEAFATPARRRGIGEELVDTLARVHAVDPAAVGLEDFGYPDGFTERQVERWSDQIAWATEVTAAERTVPTLHEVTDWLAENVPQHHPETLVHGDYKLDNVMFAPVADSPDAASGNASDLGSTAADHDVELAAVFDWEMSTLGDPLTDLGWMLSYWRDPKDPAPSLPELTTRFMEHPDYPTRRDLVERYETQTGLTYDDDRFYRALAVYKLAALGEMFFRRHLEGNADDPLYPLMEDRVPALAERAMGIVEGDEPL